jgi:hypothetical protein
MTWFEAEQIFSYLNQLEARLDDWGLSRLQMQTEKAELERLNRKLDREISGDIQPSKKNLLMELFNRIHQDETCIVERLKG